MSDTTTGTLPSRWDANASFWVQIISDSTFVVMRRGLPRPGGGR